LTTYHILPSPGADPVGDPIPETELLPTVAELSGRNVLSIGSVRTTLRRNGSVYIACSRDALWRSQGGGRGFIVKRVAS
jgi:hypothetical protein